MIRKFGVGCNATFDYLFKYSDIIIYTYYNFLTITYVCIKHPSFLYLYVKGNIAILLVGTCGNAIQIKPKTFDFCYVVFNMRYVFFFLSYKLGLHFVILKMFRYKLSLEIFYFSLLFLAIRYFGPSMV